MPKNRALAASKMAIQSILLVVLFGLLAVVNLVPVLWGVTTSIKTPTDIFAFPPKLFNFTTSLEHYVRVIEGGYFETFINSIFYSLAAIVVGLIFGLLAAYGLDRFNFRFKKPMFYLIIFCIPLSIGSSALIIPNYLYMTQIGLVDAWYTLPILYTAYNLPMAIWIIKAGVESVPVEIDEAATVDGCSKFRFIFGMLPVLCRPALAAAALIIFLGAWNEFILSSIMINNPALRPVQLAIYQYMGFFGQQWGPLTAAASIAIIPTLILFSFLGRVMISGFTQGAVK